MWCYKQLLLFSLQVFDRPAASATITLLVVIFAKIHSAQLDYVDVGASYDVSVAEADLTLGRIELLS